MWASLPTSDLEFCFWETLYIADTLLQVTIKLYMVAAVGGCVLLFSSLLLAAFLLHLRRRQAHKYLRQVIRNSSKIELETLIS